MFYKWFSYCFLLLNVSLVLLLSWSAFPSLGIFIIIKSSPALSKSLAVVTFYGGYLACIPFNWLFNSFSRSTPAFLGLPLGPYITWFYVCCPCPIPDIMLLAFCPCPPVVIPIIWPFFVTLALLWMPPAFDWDGWVFRWLLLFVFAEAMPPRPDLSAYVFVWISGVIAKFCFLVLSEIIGVLSPILPLLPAMVFLDSWELTCWRLPLWCYCGEATAELLFATGL